MPDALTHRRHFALIGWPLAGGLSAAMHNAAFAHHGLAAIYEDHPTPPDLLADAVAALRTGALAGANVTVPHKLAIRAYLDHESAASSAVGAVNMIVRRDDTLVGHNTDVVGFQAALDDAGLGGDGEGRSAVVLGAGGAARAVVTVLAGKGWAVRVLSRSTGQGGSLVAGASRNHPGAILSSGLLDSNHVLAATVDADLLVNATPIGSAAGPDASLWPTGAAMPSRLTVLDLIAYPARTTLVATALNAGCRAAGGQAMLLAQAAAAFELWTDLPAPVKVMEDALQAALEDIR